MNNAGIAEGCMKLTLDVNVRAVRNITQTFMSLLNSTKGQVINIGSKAAIKFVLACNEEYENFFLNENISWKELEDLMRTVTDDFDSSVGICRELEKLGMKKDCGDSRISYWFSKAILNSLTMLLAKEYPNLRVNSCRPGFIKTDLTFHKLADGDDEKAKKMGMKTPEEGAYSTVKLLKTENLISTGFYFGEDGLRSPLNKFREPGEVEYSGEK